MQKKSPAEWAGQRLILYLRNFEEQLDGAQEVAVGLTGAGASVIRIEGIGCFDPYIVTFYGTDQIGARTQILQHVTRLNVKLRAVPRRIGFFRAPGLEEGEDDTAGT